jgi:hypothetical protein
MVAVALRLSAQERSQTIAVGEMTTNMFTWKKFAIFFVVWVLIV